MRLLLFNMATDTEDPILGFTTDWINALAKHCTALDVVTMSVGRLAVADNVRVYSVGKERGYSEPRRALEFYRILWRLLRQNHYDACFAHMITLFVVMGAPLLKLYHIPITLWYAHKAVPRQLVLAEKFSQHVVSASPESFRLPSQKLMITGHGIDTDVFVPSNALRAAHPFTLVTIGRIAPAKRLTTLISAAALLRDEYHLPDFRVRIVGNIYPHDEDYATGLCAQVREQRLNQYVEFVGALNHTAVVHEYQAADVMINLSATGSIDKAVLEAMACAIPTITANPAFHSLLANWKDLLIVPMDDPSILAAKIASLAQQPAETRQQLGAELRQLVIQQHSLKQLSAQLIEIFVR